MKQFQVHQQKARDRTVTLVMAFLVGVCGTSMMVAALIAYLLALVLQFQNVPFQQHPLLLALGFGVSFVGCAATISTVSFFKIQELAKGGYVVAEHLGGEPIDPNTVDLDYRKVLNIVEEIAIASGVPVPPVYVLPGDSGINAFAAGYSPEDAVIGVTQGCVKRLNRDQLQGVIAHEFSHIFNGDMRLNIRMLGVLHGVLFLVVTSESIIEHGQQLMEQRRPAHRDEGDPFVTGLAMVIFGAMLWPIGMIGAMVAYLIKAATCRQREFLADASAVQFTRNPQGIGSALKTILGHTTGSRIKTPEAREVNHFFFASAGRRTDRLLLLHPPLKERILRLEPDWDGVPEFETEETLGEYDGHFTESMNLVSKTVSPFAAVNMNLNSNESTTQPAVQADETFHSDHSNGRNHDFDWGQKHVQDVFSSIPNLLIELAESGEGSFLILNSLWFQNVAPNSPLLNAASFASLTKLLPAMEKLDEGQQLILMDLALAKLDSVSGNARSLFRQQVEQLEQATPGNSVFGWMWVKLVKKQLIGTTKETERSRYGSLEYVASQSEILISLLCQIDGESPAMAEYAFQRAIQSLGLSEPKFWSCDEFSNRHVNDILDDLADVAPRARRNILVACGACISADRAISGNEAYLVRGICAGLGYHVPTLLPGQPVVPGT